MLTTVKTGPFYPLSFPGVLNYDLVNFAQAAGVAGLQYPQGQSLPQDLKVKTPRGGDEEVCLTESCVIAASNLLQQLDRTVDPCHDFYRFACGGYIDKTVLPEHKTRTGTTTWRPLEEEKLGLILLYNIMIQEHSMFLVIS